MIQKRRLKPWVLKAIGVFIYIAWFLLLLYFMIIYMG